MALLQSLSRAFITQRFVATGPTICQRRLALPLRRCRMSTQPQDDPILLYPEPPSNITMDSGQFKCLQAPKLHTETPRVSLLMELADGVGILHNVLRYFWKYDVNVSRIESRPVDGTKFDFFVDFDGQRGDDNVEKLLASLEPMTEKLMILDEKEVSFAWVSVSWLLPSTLPSFIADLFQKPAGHLVPTTYFRTRLGGQPHPRRWHSFRK